MSRVGTVTRMQFVNKWTFIWIPLIILGGAFVITQIIYLLINASVPNADTVKVGGGAQAPLWYFLSAGAMSMAATFPFSQAMSITRREFYIGTLSAAAITSAILGAIFVIGGYVEDATNGFGIGGYFFRLGWLWEAGPFIAGVFYFTAAMLFFTIGFFFATIWRRLGAGALAIGIVGFGLILIGIVAIITLTQSWPNVISFIMTMGVTGLTFGLLALTVVFAGAAYLPLRRSTP